VVIGGFELGAGQADSSLRHGNDTHYTFGKPCHGWWRTAEVGRTKVRHLQTKCGENFLGFEGPADACGEVRFDIWCGLFPRAVRGPG
jgi:hypothetical protein